MTRQYLNDRWCIRCGRKDPTPYLRKHVDIIEHCIPKGAIVADLGCGNRRNTIFMMNHGYQAIGIDMADGADRTCVIGKDPLPFKDSSVGVFLLNYLLMFLAPGERMVLYHEMKRCAAPKCLAVVELYPAKDSYAPDEKSMSRLDAEVGIAFADMGFKMCHAIKGKFIMGRE